MFNLSIFQHGAPLASKSTRRFRAGNTLALQCNLAAAMKGLGAHEEPHFYGNEYGYGSVAFVVDAVPSFHVMLSEHSMYGRVDDETLPTLAPEHVALLVEDLVQLMRSEPTMRMENLPIPVIDETTRFAIVDEYWPSLAAHQARERPRVSIRRMSADRDVLRFELDEDAEMRERDAEMYEATEPGDYPDEVEGAYVAELLGPWLPEAPAAAERRAA